MRKATPVFLLLLLLANSANAAITSTTCTTSNVTGCQRLGLSAYSNVASVSVQVTGTWVGTLVFEVSNDNSTYHAVRAYPVDGSGAYATSTTANGLWQVTPMGAQHLRVRASAWTSGSATVSMFPSSSPPVADIVRVVSSDFGTPQVTGTVALDSSTQAALSAPTCTLPSLPPVTALSTTAQDVPATPLAERTEVSVVNLDSSKEVWCCVGTGCTPTSSAAYVLLPNGGHTSFRARPSDTIRCRSSSGTASVNVLEASCG